MGLKLPHKRQKCLKDTHVVTTVAVSREAATAIKIVNKMATVALTITITAHQPQLPRKQQHHGSQLPQKEQQLQHPHVVTTVAVSREAATAIKLVNKMATVALTIAITAHQPQLPRKQQQLQLPQKRQKCPQDTHVVTTVAVSREAATAIKIVNKMATVALTITITAHQPQLPRKQQHHGSQLPQKEQQLQHPHVVTTVAVSREAATAIKLVNKMATVALTIAITAHQPQLPRQQQHHGLQLPHK
ncbi:uncharacterized protein LOC125018921 isoform X4 [Mugil cephalus]|uniref:uncharacterized protein LOC125018921 isoform X4 n=1 Tax=Mugil cephalus TaxID=48193 RepID=UPI001FB5F555|nr:uncharacterized protein LOC125018921 isoform X4 [Mugil cephalus]